MSSLRYRHSTMGPISSTGRRAPRPPGRKRRARHVGKTALGYACPGIAEDDVRVTRRDPTPRRSNARRSQCPPRGRCHPTHGLIAEETMVPGVVRVGEGSEGALADERCGNVRAALTFLLWAPGSSLPRISRDRTPRLCGKPGRNPGARRGLAGGSWARSRRHPVAETPA